MKLLFYLFLGGGLGTLFRYGIGKLIQPSSGLFPWHTLVANFMGCLFIGLFIGWLSKGDGMRNDIYLLATVGFCGGLTTFSTFSLESLQLLKSGHFLLFASYLTASLLGGLLFVVLGHFIVKGTL